MDYEKIVKELEDNTMLRNLFEIVTRLSPEGIRAVSTFAVKCYDKDCEGAESPECYDVVEQKKGSGFRVEVRRVGELDEESISCPPFKVDHFYRAVVYVDARTKAGAELLKKLLTSDFGIEDIEPINTEPWEQKFEIISCPMHGYKEMDWYQGLGIELECWAEGCDDEPDTIPVC